MMPHAQSTSDINEPTDVEIVRAILHAHQRAYPSPDSGWGDMSFEKGSYDSLSTFQAALKAYRQITQNKTTASINAEEPGYDRELAAAVVKYMGESAFIPQDWESHSARNVAQAMQKYRPAPEKEYTMPTWEEFTKSKSSSANGWSYRLIDFDLGHGIRIMHDQYNAVREATAKVKG